MSCGHKVASLSLGGVGGGEGQDKEETTDIKSNNPHLTRGEKEPWRGLNFFVLIFSSGWGGGPLTMDTGS